MRKHPHPAGLRQPVSFGRVTGDPQQSDLLPGISGLSDIAERLKAVPDISVVKLAEGDIVRHPLVASMIGVL